MNTIIHWIRVSISISLYLLYSQSVFGFLLNPTNTSPRSSFLIIKNHNNPSSSVIVDLESFDFSSQNGWNDFYKINQDQSFEWHSSIPHSYIVNEIDRGSQVLLVGTGNSQLPRILYDHHEHSTQVICMDYSEPCIESLKRLHAKDCPHMKFMCGDVMHLQSLLKDHVLDATIHNDGKDCCRQCLDYVIDKGLMDALMCNEGFCFSLEKYLRQVASVLKKDGKFILISYKLIPSTREFLQIQGDALGMQWQFDIREKSNDRVSFSVGTLQREFDD